MLLVFIKFILSVAVVAFLLFGLNPWMWIPILIYWAVTSYENGKILISKKRGK